jgi:hypothetical protein
MKKMALGCLLVAGLVFGSAGAAVAGETRGNGDPNDNSGQPRSACHFSGLDQADDVEAEGGQPPAFNDGTRAVRGNQSPGGEDRYHGVQNWGSFARTGDVPPAGPGEECRGNAVP